VSTNKHRVIKNFQKSAYLCEVVRYFNSDTSRMATQQDEGGVPFSVAHEQQHFRLLELPPEIVELIDAPNPPL
jgi:hypothetical protein